MCQSFDQRLRGTLFNEGNQLPVILFFKYATVDCTIFFFCFTCHHPPPHIATGRRRGPARQACDRARAAKFQAAKVAPAEPAATASEPTAVASKAEQFPGKGRIVGSADGPGLPVPLANGVFFPPPSPH